MAPEIFDPATYTRVSLQDLERFGEIIGPRNVITDKSECDWYGRDETEDLCYPPEVVLKPAATNEVAAIMKYCYARRIPVTPRGAGTGLSGGALPVYGGVSLSLERMNKIIGIDPINMSAVVQPGVITGVFQDEVEARGLFYPPDPASRYSCFLGGNVAENAGGPRALKYGVTRDYVIGLEVVLASGEVMRVGRGLLKDVCGYDLVHLLVGSEGTLAVFTEISFKLIPRPAAEITLAVPFSAEAPGLAAITAVFAAGLLPAACEFIGRRAYALNAAAHGDLVKVDGVEAMILIRLDGHCRSELDQAMEKIGTICLDNGAIDVFVADSPARSRSIWEWRSHLGRTVKSAGPYKEEDAVVPRARLVDLYRVIAELETTYGLDIAAYGHAGDGNIHINIIRPPKLDPGGWNRRLEPAVRELFAAVVKLGGTITGEHGVGLTQKKYLPIVYPPAYINLLRRVKEVFDPRYILNPGKIFPAPPP